MAGAAGGAGSIGYIQVISQLGQTALYFRLLLFGSLLSLDENTKVCPFQCENRPMPILEMSA
jgi:hypothetical protein